MKIFPNQLSQELPHFNGNIILIFGNEPLQKKETIDRLRYHYRQQGFQERINFVVNQEFNWSHLEYELNTQSLFSHNKIIEIEITADKFLKPAQHLLSQHLEQKNSKQIIILFGSKLEQKTLKSAVFKKLEQQSLFIHCQELTMKAFQYWLKQRLQQLNLSFTQDAIQLMLQWYMGNLLAAAGELEKISLQHPIMPIDAQWLLANTENQSQYHLFHWIDSILQRQQQQSVEIFIRLQALEIEPIMLSWALNQELLLLLQLKQSEHSLNQAFKQFNIWPKKQPYYQQILQQLSFTQLSALIEKATVIDQAIKQSRLHKPYYALLHLMLQFIHPGQKNLQQLNLPIIELK